MKQKFIAEKSTQKGPKGSKPGVHVSKGPSQSAIKAAAKEASDRFSRLGLVTAILRGAGRERYDHFLSNGFPKWKGTGYYYARFRPGFFSVLLGLFIGVGGGFHYVFLYMSWKRQQDFVGRYIKFARHSAWGDTLNIPGLDDSGTATPPVATGDSEAEAAPIPRNRKERRLMEKEERKEKPDKKSKLAKAAKASPADTPPIGATGRKKRVQAENGKMLIVDSVGNVFLEQRDENGQMQEFLLDVSYPFCAPSQLLKIAPQINELPAPTIKDTALYRLPLWTVGRLTGLLRKKTDGAQSDDEFDEQVDAGSSEEAEDFEVLEKVKTSSQNGNGKAVKRGKKNGRGR